MSGLGVLDSPSPVMSGGCDDKPSKFSNEYFHSLNVFQLVVFFTLYLKGVRFYLLKINSQKYPEVQLD